MPRSKEAIKMQEGSNRVRGKRQREGEKGHRDAVANRRQLFMIHCKKLCPLKLSARMAWSYLLLRGRKNRTASRHGTHKYTGLGRKAADAAAKELVGHGLAEETATGRLRAVRPADDKVEWFATKQKARGPWHSSYAYLVVPIPAKGCPLTDAQNAVLWCVVDQLSRDRPINSHGVARMVGCNRRTVSQALGRLSELRLLEVTRWPGRRSWTEVTLLEPPEGFADWYQPKRDQKQESKAVQHVGPRLDPCLESWVSDLADRGFREDDMARIRKKLIELEIAGVEPQSHLLDPILEDAETVHSQRGKGPNCVNLLLYKIDRWAARRVAVPASGPARPDPAVDRMDRQEAEEKAALAPLAEFDHVRRLPCPACGESMPNPFAEERVAEDRLSADARAVLDDVRRCLPPRAGLALPGKCLLRCRCRPEPSEVAYVQITFSSKGIVRHVLLPKDWEAVPSAGVKPVQPALPGQANAAHRESDLGVLED